MRNSTNFISFKINNDVNFYDYKLSFKDTNSNYTCTFLLLLTR